MSSTTQPLTKEDQADSAPPTSSKSSTQPKSSGNSQAKAASADAVPAQAPKKSGVGTLLLGAFLVLVVGMLVSNVLNEQGPKSASLTNGNEQHIKQKWQNLFILDEQQDSLVVKMFNRRSLANKTVEDTLESLLDDIVSNHTNIRHLTIERAVTHALNTEQLGKMGPSLARISNLEGLSINFESNRRASVKGSQNLLDGFGSINKNLKRLSINFRESNLINDDALIAITSTLKRDFKHLKELSFNFAATQISDKSFTVFIGTIAEELKDLEVLDINLRWIEAISDGSLKAFGMAAADHFRNLKSLTMILTQCQRVTDKGFADVAANACYNLENLESLSLQFNGLKLTNGAIRSMVNDIEKLKKLKKLHLDVSSNDKINDEGILLLVDALKAPQFNSITDLNLGFANVYGVTEKSMKLLVSLLGQKLTNLESVTLALPRIAQISTETWKSLVTTIGRNLKGLRHLNLDVSGQAGFNDEVLSQFANTIGHSQSIETLIFQHFSEKAQIDKGLNQLFETIAERLQGLKSLKFTLYDFAKISNENLINLSKVLPVLHKLEEFELVLSGSRVLSDAGIMQLAKALDESKGLHTSLKSLLFDFSASGTIGDNGATALISSISENYHQLHTLGLEFMGLSGVTNVVPELIATNTLSNLPNLSSLSLTFYGCDGITGLGYKALIDEISSRQPNLSYLNLFVGADNYKDAKFDVRNYFYQKLSFIPAIVIH